MGVDIFDGTLGKPTIFFVGGTGTRAGTAIVGCCSQEYWDSKVAAVGALAAFESQMGSNGGNLVQASFTAVNSGPFTVQCNNIPTANLEVGMYGKFNFSSVYTNGYYRIASILDADSIVLDLTYTSNAAGNCYFGGAWPDVEEAISITVETAYQNVTVYDNQGNTNLNAELRLDVGGNPATGTIVRFKGFDTFPEDGVNVVYDVNGNDNHGLAIEKSFSSVSNLWFHNYTVKNAGNGIVEKFNLHYKADFTAGHNVGFVDCNFEDCNALSHNVGLNNTSTLGPLNLIFVNCSFDGANGYGVRIKSLTPLGQIVYVNCHAYDCDNGVDMQIGIAIGCSFSENNINGVGLTGDTFLIDCILAGNVDGLNGTTGDYVAFINSIASNNTSNQMKGAGSGYSVNSSIVGSESITGRMLPSPEDNTTDDLRFVDITTKDFKAKNTKRKALGINTIFGEVGQHGPAEVLKPSRDHAQNSLVNQFTT